MTLSTMFNKKLESIILLNSILIKWKYNVGLNRFIYSPFSILIW